MTPTIVLHYGTISTETDVPGVHAVKSPLHLITLASWFFLCFLSIGLLADVIQDSRLSSHLISTPPEVDPHLSPSYLTPATTSLILTPWAHPAYCILLATLGPLATPIRTEHWPEILMHLQADLRDSLYS